MTTLYVTLNRTLVTAAHYPTSIYEQFSAAPRCIKPSTSEMKALFDGIFKGNIKKTSVNIFDTEADAQTHIVSSLCQMGDSQGSYMHCSSPLYKIELPDSMEFTPANREHFNISAKMLFTGPILHLQRRYQDLNQLPSNSVGPSPFWQNSAKELAVPLMIAIIIYNALTTEKFGASMIAFILTAYLLKRHSAPSYHKRYCDEVAQALGKADPNRVYDTVIISKQLETYYRKRTLWGDYPDLLTIENGQLFVNKKPLEQFVADQDRRAHSANHLAARAKCT